jgi:hypothetical protein
MENFMKHETIDAPSTKNVLKMFFECRTFNENSEVHDTRDLEALINVEDKKINFVGYTTKEMVQTISI